nr:immunoglobulin heavy chain junction region [Macaca mulatta]
CARGRGHFLLYGDSW